MKMDGEKRGIQKTQIGEVIRSKMQKSVLVEVRSRVQHPIFGKYVTRRKKLMAHDEKGECRVGDKVQLVATRPISKNKRWRVNQILNRSVQVEGIAEGIEV